MENVSWYPHDNNERKVRSNIVNNIKFESCLRTFEIVLFFRSMLVLGLALLALPPFFPPFSSVFRLLKWENSEFASMVGVYKKEYIVCIISRVQSTEEEAREETSWIHRRAPGGIARLSHSTSTLNTKIESTSSSSSFHGSAQYASKILSINSQEGMKEYLGIRSYGLELWNFHSPKISFFSPLRSFLELESRAVGFSWVFRPFTQCMREFENYKRGIACFEQSCYRAHIRNPQRLRKCIWIWEKVDNDFLTMREERRWPHEQGLLLAK